jgi:hypothetical protein
LIGNLKTKRACSRPLKFQIIHPPYGSGLSTRCPGIKNQITMRKKIFLSAAILAVAVSAYAQGNGQAGITEATNLITGYFDPGTKLVYAIGAVCGLIGGVKVYNKFSSGDPDTSKTAASWFGACIFLIVAATILRSFFL